MTRRLCRSSGPHLQKLGYDVATAEDGTSAMSLARTTLADLVVLDVYFPESHTLRRLTVGGIEVLRRLCESGNVLVLMLSTTNISTVKVMALSMAADDYVSKHFLRSEGGGCPYWAQPEED